MQISRLPISRLEIADWGIADLAIEIADCAIADLTMQIGDCAIGRLQSALDPPLGGPACF
jgi:hypothetical protein